jgi:hypothetical protein
MDKDFFEHHGILGMRWGHHKVEDFLPSAFRKKSVAEQNADILKENPYAAVLDHKAIKKPKLTKKQQEARRQHDEKILLGLGVGVTLTVAAAAMIYSRNPEGVERCVSGFFSKFGGKGVSELVANKPLIDITAEEQAAYKKLGFNVGSKKDIVKTNWLATWCDHDLHRYDIISEAKYKSLDDNDLIVKAGQTLNRITTAENEVVRPGAYISFHEDDANRYKVFMPMLWRANYVANEKTKIYHMTMEAVEDLKSPSAKKRVDLITELIKTHPEFAKESGYDLAGHMNAAGVSPEVYSKRLYNTFATRLCNPDYRAGQIYKEELQKRGYNALVDDNDAGRLARLPLILLDPEKTIKTKTVNQLTKESIKAALASLQPMPGENLETTEATLRKSRSLRPLVNRLNDILETLST